MLFDGEEVTRRNDAAGQILDANQLGKTRRALTVFPLAHRPLRHRRIELRAETGVRNLFLFEIVEEFHGPLSNWRV